jgi:hypothetical protein
MATENGNIRWIVALCVTISLSLAGWFFGAIQTTKVQLLSRQATEIERLAMYAVSNDKRITTLESNYGNLVTMVREGFVRLETLWAQHVTGKVGG